jgi:hypothetical protein
MPLAPLGLFRLRNLAISNVVGVVSAAAMLALVLPLGPSASRKPRETVRSRRSRVATTQPSSSALFAAGAAFIGGVFLRPKDMPAHEHEEAVGVPAVAEADSGARPR